MYCSEIWGNTYVTNIQCIILLQKSVIRLIHGANRWVHTNSFFYSYRIQKITDIFELNTILRACALTARRCAPNSLKLTTVGPGSVYGR